jgi:GNAT superfamily N-acetyltransferase
MLDDFRAAAGDAIDRAIVTVVFLRMNHRPLRPSPAFPPGAVLTRQRLTVPEYRDLYAAVGAPWLWWLRRIMPDETLARHLASPTVAITLLRVDGRTAGFFETDAGPWPDVNLNYFGLLPDMIGKGYGRALLAAAVDSVFGAATSLRGMTVNTCNADHPNALPNYLAAGFTEVRRVREVWDIPRRLGLTIPEHLRG